MILPKGSKYEDMSICRTVFNPFLHPFLTMPELARGLSISAHFQRLAQR